MKILVLGGNGGTGKHLVTQALAQGHDVTVLVRDPAAVATSHPRLTVVKGRATVESELQPVVHGQDAILGALGAHAKADTICADAAITVVAAMKREGVKRVVWLSAGGVGDSAKVMIAASFIFGRIIMPRLLAKPYANHLLAEETLRASGLEWTVLRPVQLVDTSTGAPVRATAPTVKPTSLKIARQDLAGFMLEELEAKAHLRQMPLVYA